MFQHYVQNVHLRDAVTKHAVFYIVVRCCVGEQLCYA